MLWLAFKNCIFDITNNWFVEVLIMFLVVISFQKLYLWHHKQRYETRTYERDVVISFQKLYLWHHKQLICFNDIAGPSCD